MRTIERHLQQNLNKIEHWSTNNGFKFSKSKTQCVDFCQLQKQHDQEYKYLGLIFYKKLSFIPHVKYLKADCLKSLKILKVLSQTTLLQLYRSLIRSKLDYGSIVFAFRTSPTASLYVEADEPSLKKYALHILPFYVNFGTLFLTGGMECSQTDQCTFTSF